MYIHISSLMTHKSKLQILEFLRKLHVAHKGSRKKKNLTSTFQVAKLNHSKNPQCSHDPAKILKEDIINISPSLSLIPNIGHYWVSSSPFLWPPKTTDKKPHPGIRSEIHLLRSHSLCAVSSLTLPPKQKSLWVKVDDDRHNDLPAQLIRKLSGEKYREFSLPIRNMDENQGGQLP